MKLKIGVPNNIFFYILSFLKEKGFFGEINPTFIPVDNYTILKSLFLMDYFDIIICDLSFIDQIIQFNLYNEDNLKNKNYNKKYIYPLSFKNFYKIFINKELLMNKNSIDNIIAGIPEDNNYFKDFIEKYLNLNNISCKKILFKTINEKDVIFFLEKKYLNITISIAPYSFEIIKKNLGIIGNLLEEENTDCNCILIYFSESLIGFKDKLNNFFENLLLGLNIFSNNKEFLNEIYKKYKILQEDDFYLISEDLNNNILFNEELLRNLLDRRVEILPFLYYEHIQDNELKNRIIAKINEIKKIEDKNKLYKIDISKNNKTLKNIISYTSDKNYNQSLNFIIKSMLNKKKININEEQNFHPSIIFELYNNLIYEYEMLIFKNNDLNNKIKILENSLQETQNNLYNIFNDLNKTTENLVIQKIRADEAIKVKSKFFASITHDLKTPIYGINSMIDSLLKEEFSENKREILLKIKRSGETLLSLIEDLLTISKAEENKLQLSKKIFNFDELLKELYDNIYAKLKEKDVELIFDKEDKVPEFLIGDSLRIKQILYNLLGNSSKFTEKGFIKLNIKCDIEENNFIKLYFEVIDTGIGIRKDKIDKIFEPFEQENEDIKYKYGGSGLGLSIVKKLVELMNGEIKCESEQGKGTKFHFYIFLEIPDKEEINDYIKNYKENINILSKNINFFPSNIIIAEDNEINIGVIKDIFNNIKNINISIFKDGESAFEEILKNRNYKILITDIQMPKMDGIDLAKRIREQNIPIIIIGFTAFETDFMENSSKVYFDEIFEKPYNEEKFIKILTKHIGIVHRENDLKDSEIIKEENIKNKPNFDFEKEKEINKVEKIEDNKKVDDYIGVSNFEKLKKLFIEETEKKLVIFKKGIEEKNLKDIRFIGHNLKGTAPIFGFREIGEIGKKISSACNNEDFKELEKLYNKLKIELNKIK